MCEYNLNFIKEAEEKAADVSAITNSKKIKNEKETDLEKLVKNNEFGYWMRTGNKSANDATGERYNEVFSKNEMITSL